MQQANHSARITIEAEAGASSCAGAAELSWLWETVSIEAGAGAGAGAAVAAPALYLDELARVSPTLTLPRFSLRPAHAYHLQVTLTATLGGSFTTRTAMVTVQVQPIAPPRLQSAEYELQHQEVTSL